MNKYCLKCGVKIKKGQNWCDECNRKYLEEHKVKNGEKLRVEKK